MTLERMSAREFSPHPLWLQIKRQLKNLALTLPGLRAFILVSRIHLDNAVCELGKIINSLRGITPTQALRKRALPIQAQIYTATDGLPSFQVQSQPGKPRGVVYSIPKSGTHLMHAVLAELGLIPCNVFINESAFDDQRFLKDQDMVLDQRRKIPCPLALSSELVRPGQFALSHLICAPSVQAHFKDYRQFFICRELRQMYVSNMRWRMKEGHGDEFGLAWKSEPDDKRRMEKFMELYAQAITNTNREIAPWKSVSSVLHAKFETLCGDEGSDAQRALIKAMAAHIGMAIDDTKAIDVIGKALGSHTKTWSGGRSHLDRYWTDKCEEIFRRHGGPELNGFLGYPERP